MGGLGGSPPGIDTALGGANSWGLSSRSSLLSSPCASRNEPAAFEAEVDGLAALPDRVDPAGKTRKYNKEHVTFTFEGR